MPLPISGLVPQKVSIRAPQGVMEQLFIALASKMGLSRITGLPPMGVPYTIDFSVMPTPQYIDLSTSQLKNQLGQVKTVYVDNSDNDASVTITCAVTKQQIIVAAGRQAYMPVASAVGQFQIDTSGADLVGFTFLNVDVAPAQWDASPSTTTIGSVLMAGSAGIDHSANEPAYPPAGLTLLATVAANTSRAELCVQNQSANQIQVFLVTSGGGHIPLLLESGGLANTGGADWRSLTFKGGLTVYGQAGACVAVYET